MEVLSKTIGINLWFKPQISEHWPKYNPGRLMLIIDWLIRPGIASILIPKLGTVHEWITSSELINKRICDLKGIIILLSTSNNRKLNFFIL